MIERKDLEGVMLGQYVMGNLANFTSDEIDSLVQYYRSGFHPNLNKLLDVCARRAKLNGKQLKDYWGGDCGELMERHISFIKQEAKKYNATVDDNNAANFFLFIVFSLSQKAAKNPIYKWRIVRALNRYDKEFKRYVAKTFSPDSFWEELEKNSKNKRAILDNEILPVSQMEVGTEFTVQWNGVEAVARVEYKDADRRSVVGIYDQDDDPIEVGIDDISDEDWEAIRVKND